MAFLDPKERIFDVVLTNRGRELMAKNQLRFEFYAFSDEGINYSGSLSASAQQSSSLDDYIFRQLSFEADQRKNGLTLPKNNDLGSFLFTIPSKSKVLPTFVVSVEEDDTIQLRRRFFIDTLILHTRKRNSIRKPLAIIARATVPRATLLRRMQNYVTQQRCDKTASKWTAGKNIVGLPVAGNMIALTNALALNVQTGGSKLIEESLFNRTRKSDVDAVSVKKEIEVIQGLDEVKIDLKLQNFEGAIESKDGFLIEVFLSGTDGLLTKINRDELVDFIDDKTKEDGFSEFLALREE